MEETQLVPLLVEHGPVGILALGLAFALRIVWRRYDGLQRKFNEVQEKRIQERDVVVTALNDSNRLMNEVTQYMASRRR